MDLAAKVGCRADGSTFTGRRLSGQTLVEPLGSLGSLQIGANLGRDVPVGIFDMHAMAGLRDVEGFVSFSFFRAVPVTIDYSAGLVVMEDEASLARRAAAGTSVPVRIAGDGPEDHP